jgi:hypothetical protein
MILLLIASSKPIYYIHSYRIKVSTEKQAFAHPCATARHGANQSNEEMKNKRQAQTQHTTTAWRLRAQSRPSTQIAKVIVGNAFVSVLPRRCPLVRIRSLGHRPRVHGTTAQYKLATSPCLNVVRNCWAAFLLRRPIKAQCVG